MNWLKNEWEKGGSRFPEHIKQDNGFLSGTMIQELQQKGFAQRKPTVQLYSTKIGDEYYYMTFPLNGDNFVHANLEVDELKHDTDDEIRDSFYNEVFTYNVPAFIGDTLEIDDEHTKNDSPFTGPLLNANRKKFKIDKQVVSSLEVIKKVLNANQDKLSVVIIGNHENVSEGNIYQTAEDKKHGVKYNITLSAFMQKRAEVYKTAFFSGVTNVITMGADSEQNIYKDDHNTSIEGSQKKYLMPGKNLEGISVVFLLKGESDHVR